MKVTLDRRHCTRWQGACESCFANHLAHGDFDTADCGMNIVEDGRKTVEFSITDRDGSFKTLTITPRNQAEAIDSWLLLWQQQAGVAA
ncbi:MAG: hypothetical protein ACRDFQ_02305 [Anaerolineales bacterium]